MKKAQISYEAIFTFGIVLLLFVIVLALTVNKEIDASNTKVFLDDRKECLKLSNEIFSVYMLGDNAVSNVNLLKRVSVVGNTIKVGSFICDACCNFTKVNTTTFNLSVGIVNLKNNRGTVGVI